ncbi:MAG: pyridoxamine 5'-phosphate oxidase [Steroidobacteraceae bacterium]
MPIPVQFLPDPLPAEPLSLAAQWLELARSRRDQPNPNAMVLATVGPSGRPSARVVLCKDIVAQPGYVSFYTNYLSRKGQEIDTNPRVAIVMHWDHLYRQLRLEGYVVRAPAAESDSYFRSRPWQRRVGAWASAQSQPVSSRRELETAVAEVAHRYGVPVPGPEDAPSPPGLGDSIPRPPHWGGYHVWVDAVELWVEGESRIHDRARWVRKLSEELSASGTPTVESGWSVTRLQP